MNIVRLYLLGVKGYSVLSEIILQYGPEIIDEVIIGKDHAVLDDYSDKIENICLHNNIVFYNRNQDTKNTKKISIAIGWRWIIDLDRVENLIVIHDSLLPRYRGFNPLVTALINGDRQIGATALFATLKYDEGEIIDKASIDITYPIKISEAMEEMSKCYTSLVINIVQMLQNGYVLPRRKQENIGITYSLWRDEDDYNINWNWKSEKIKRFVDAVGYPYKGAQTFVNSERIGVYDVIEYCDVVIENRLPGKIIFLEDHKPIVVCGKGLLKINEMRTSDDKLFCINSIRTKFK